MRHNPARLTIGVVFAVFIGGFFTGMEIVAASGSDEGRAVFEKRCTGCHGLDTAKEGPRLRGVYGRRAGQDEGFGYSDALRNAQITWDESTLDRWLADTEIVVPGNEMSFRLNNAAERKQIVAFLKTLPAK
jgi:cytochrome c